MTMYLSDFQVKCNKFKLDAQRLIDEGVVKCHFHGCDMECFSAEMIAKRFNTSVDVAYRLVNDYQNRIDNDESVLEDLEVRESLIGKLVEKEIAVAAIYNDINRRRRKISMRHHSVNSDIDEDALKLVLEGRFDKVTIDEWISSLYYFGTVYPVSIPGYNI